MEIIDLAKKKELFAPPEERYKNPHKEALQIRQLWTNYKPTSRSKEMQQARSLHKQAMQLVQEDEEDFSSVLHIIKKGLFFNPKFHSLYALRGDIYMRKGQWTKAVKNYDNARKMVKFDYKLTEVEMKDMYTQELAASYRKRGDWYFENSMLLEALSDYEQVFLLKLKEVLVINVQDKILKLLRKLDKYDLFQHYWDIFLENADPIRTAALLAVHAEYKIHIKQMACARHMLLKALSLDENNVQAQELLQKVYDAGHTLSTYTVIWCMHSCYDKALVTIEKALECNPYNPGFSLLKTIVLRISGRSDEAMSYLENVSKNFDKLLEPGDTKSSIVGRLSVKEARAKLIKQWYLIKYDKAMECMLKNKFEHAARIIYKSQLTKYHMEPYITLGDSLFNQNDINLALESYLKCQQKIRDQRLPCSQKTVDLIERIIDILNDRAKKAVNAGRLNDAIRLTDKILQLIDDNEAKIHRLGMHRGRALFLKARSLFQITRKQKEQNKKCCEIAAESLKFAREPEDADLYQTLYGERSIEDIIDKFAPKRKLPQSLKILMQYS